MAQPLWAVLPEGQEDRVREVLDEMIMANQNVLIARVPICYKEQMHAAFITTKDAAELLYGKKREGDTFFILKKDGPLRPWRLWQNGASGATGINRNPFNGRGAGPFRK